MYILRGHEDTMKTTRVLVWTRVHVGQCFREGFVIEVLTNNRRLRSREAKVQRGPKVVLWARQPQGTALVYQGSLVVAAKTFKVHGLCQD